MPNYFAHLQFGDRVLAAVPEPLRTRLEKERGAYTLGQYGPDPLYFYFRPGGGRVRAAGRAVHHQPVRPVMERMRRAVEAGKPLAAGYAAGFLCHFALDSRCHAYIRGQADGRTVTHGSLESEFDRFLMVRGGRDPTRETPLNTPAMPEDFDRFLETVYPGITGEQYREGLRFYRKVSGWHTRTAGSRGAGRWFDLAARASRRGVRFRDMVLKREPGSAEAHRNGELLALFEREIPAAAEKLVDFLEGRPLGRWFDRDFYGEGFSRF